MANTSLSLGPYWEKFIKQEVQSGRYGSASEVVRDGLRTLESRDGQLQRLRDELAEGVAQAKAGIFSPPFTSNEIIADIERNLNVQY